MEQQSECIKPGFAQITRQLILSLIQQLKTAAIEGKGRPRNFPSTEVVRTPKMTDPISNFIKSKILGLASLLLLIASMATITAVFLPFWFSLHMHLEFVEDEKPQQTSVDRSINCGLFFLDENRFVNTIMLDKADNTHFMPGNVKNLQISYLDGVLYRWWSKFRNYNFVLHNLKSYNMKIL